ncbi:MAG: tyrosine-protein kinase [Rickettsia endosymbiont of Ixodes persulcatus]|nr:tyrosine-protein kinase [Rickettsia endosymbiont of Ixodes persulcatus]
MFENLIGEGNFGKVFRGKLEMSSGSEMIVAIKTSKKFNSHEENNQFLREAVMTQYLSHEHVISLIGYSFKENRPMILLPFMSNGDLLSYIRINHSTLSETSLIQFVQQVAVRMNYLASNGFVHRDLAARNCLLDDNLTVKVGDFGLTHQINDKAYYRMARDTKLPVFWMAIESLEYQVFTEKSDVWSFGVTCWEVMTRGRVPYVGIEPSKLLEHLMNGHRLEQPNKCSIVMYNLMLDCWETIEDRPTFATVVGRLVAEDTVSSTETNVQYSYY